MNKGFRIILIVLLTGVLGFSLYKVGVSLREYRVGSTAYDELAERNVVVHPSNPQSPPVTVPSADASAEPVLPDLTEEAPIEVDFESLLAENGDVVAWLYSEGTPIQYPVVQADDNAKYLRHLLNGKYNIAGTLFVDYRNEKPFKDLNTVIYGHNLRNDEMFGTLLEYEKEEYYREHPVMWLLTPNATYKLTVIGGLHTTTSSNAYQFQMTRQDVKSFLNAVVQKMPYRTAADLSDVTRIVTLSTCSYESDDARYVLVASLQKVG